MLDIVQGEDIEFEIKLEDENEDSYNLSSVTELTLAVKRADGTTLNKTQTAGDITIVGSQPQNGKIKVKFSDADTALLKVATAQDFELLIDEGTNRKIVQFLKQLNVAKRVA